MSLLPKTQLLRLVIDMAVSESRPLTKSELALLARETAELDAEIAVALSERPRRFNFTRPNTADAFA